MLETPSQFIKIQVAPTMGKPEFVHLHNHSEYSLLDGLIRFTDKDGKPSELLRNLAQLVAHEPDRYERVAELNRRFADLDLGFVDAAVIAIAEATGVRRIATETGGDLVATEITATQCWACDLVTSFYDDSDDQHPTQGDVSACVFEAPLD